MENKEAYKTHFKNLEEMGKSVGKELGNVRQREATGSMTWRARDNERQRGATGGNGREATDGRQRDRQL